MQLGIEDSEGFQRLGPPIVWRDFIARCCRLFAKTRSGPNGLSQLYSSGVGSFPVFHARGGVHPRSAVTYSPEGAVKTVNL